ncbi:hypothetical protein HYV82_06785 [Candidatus Woesearchaeota archaeon]|nr:hypothetical protein [Candidatus Woesearchaeota archaeon]
MPAKSMPVNELSDVVADLQALNRWTVRVDLAHSYRIGEDWFWVKSLWVKCCDLKRLTPEEAARLVQEKLGQAPADFPRYYIGTHTIHERGDQDEHRIEIGYGYYFSMQGITPYMPLAALEMPRKMEERLSGRAVISYSKTHWPGL